LFPPDRHGYGRVLLVRGATMFEQLQGDRNRTAC
jgi:hypothetical protein